MNCRLLSLCVRIGLLLAVVSAASAQESGTKYALLIGIGSYQTPGSIPGLHFTSNDLQELAALLRKDNYDVTPIANDQAFRANIIRELYKFADKLKPEDTFLLYFSGHGVRNPRINQSPYWVTYRTSLEVLDDEGIRLSHLMDYVRDIPAKKKIVLLDHCFSGDLVDALADNTARGVVLASAATPPSVAGATQPVSTSRATDHQNALRKTAFPDQQFKSFDVRPDDVGVVVLTAARDEAFELETLQHGVFTKSILNACATPTADSNGDGVISMDELMAFLDGDVPKLAATVQRQQRVLPYHVGTGLNRWIFCTVGVTAKERVERDARDYEIQVSAWKLKALIDDRVQARCMTALVNWALSKKDNSALAEEDQRIVNSVVTAIKGVGSERVRAATLNAEILAILSNT